MPPRLNVPEERLWRTDFKKGRGIYALLSNDIARPSDEDPLIGTMESSIVAENVVNTHNGAMSLYGRRYAQVLADAEINPPDNPKQEVYFKLDRTDLDREEYSQLLAIARWLYKGPIDFSPIVEKLYRALGGEEGRTLEEEDG